MQCFNIFDPNIIYRRHEPFFIESRDLNSVTSSINIDPQNLFNWCLHNKLDINLKKTTYTILKNPQNQYQFADNSTFIHKTAIIQVFTIEFLGVFIDTHLNWSHHICKLIENMRPIAGLFFRLSNHIPRRVLTILNNFLIHSKISYCIGSCGNALKTHVDKLTKFQKEIIHIIFKKPIVYPSFKVFKCSKLLSIDQMYQLKVLMSARSLFYASSTNPSQNYSTQSSLFCFVFFFFYF